MTLKEFELLKERTIGALLEENLSEDPALFALRHSQNGFPVALVSIQLKNLRKCRTKLPRFYEARCLLPTKAFEQASSARSTALRSFSGQHCLDLCTGLGADAAHFSQNFAEVITVDRDPVLIAVAQENFRRMGIPNIKTISARVEDLLSKLADQAFDLVFIDPDRRIGTRRTHTLHGMQPDLQAILPELLRVGRTVAIKLSPLFDIDEAFRAFPGLTELTIISIDNEIKEVLVVIDQDSDRDEVHIQLAVDRPGFRGYISLPREVSFAGQPKHQNWRPSFIFEPDAGFYKSNRLPWLADQLRQRRNQAEASHRHGYIFCSQPPSSAWPGTCWSIERSAPWSPKKIKKLLKGESIKKAEIHRRNFPLKIEAIRKSLGLKPGNHAHLLFTHWREKPHFFWVAPVVRD